MNFPWLAPVLERLPRQASELPRSLLIAGPAGLGKREAALYLARSSLCETPRAGLDACGKCASCLLLDAGTHPDLRILEVGQEEPEEAGAGEDAQPASAKKPGKQISVDKVRALMDFVTITSHRGGPKVVCIVPAEAMHPSAANAVLKILEEPPGDTRFLLVSHRPDRVLATIRSRCFKLEVALPEAGPALAWLKNNGVANAELALAQGGYAPLAAMERTADSEFWESRKAFLDTLASGAFDPLRSAERAEPIETGVVALLLSRWAYDLAAIRSGKPVRYHRDYAPALEKVAARVDGTDLMHWYDQVLRFGRAAQHPLNKRLATESVLAGYPG